jgi:competence protein ComEC
MLVAQRSGRRLPAVAVLAAPGLLTALLMPSDTKTASFALSYAAVAGLLLAPLPARPCSVARVLAYAFVASFAATLATAPITLHLFGQLAPWTILATPLLSPLVALMLGLGLVVGLLSSLGADVAMLALLLRAATSLYATAVEHLAELPGTPILAVCQPPAAVLVAAVLLCGLAVCAWPNRASAAAVCTLLSLPHFVPWPQRATPGLHLLDVGHGQACLLTLPQRQRVLVDCGSLHQPVLAAHAVVRALAPSRHLDLVVLTHADADHTHGLPFLLRRVRVAAVAMPKEMETHAICAEVARSGARVCLVAPGERSAPWPGLTLARPLAPLPARSNDAGLWVHADLGGFNACLPGDAEEPGVHAWLASPWQQRADVLVLPHHGRAHGAVGALLERVRPALALVSGGVHDAPAPQAVVARRRGITALETAQVGDVRVDASEQMRVQTARPVPVWPVAK